MKRILTYLAGNRVLLMFSMLLAVINVAGTLVIPVLTGNAIDVVLGVDAVAFSSLKQILFKMIVVIMVSALAGWLMTLVNNRIAYKMVLRIRRDAFNRLQKVPLETLDRQSSGDLVSRLITDADTFSDGLLLGFSQLFTGVLTIVGTLLFMLITNWRITLIVVILTPLSFLVAGYIARKTSHLFTEQARERGRQTSYIEEIVGNQKTVNAYGFETKCVTEFSERNESLRKASLKAVFFSSLTNPCTRFINGLVYAGVGIYGTFLAANGVISIGRIATFLSYANQYTKPFNEISGVLTEFQNALACARRIFEVTDAKPEVADDKNAVVLNPEAIEGSVVFDRVSFSYVPDKKLIEDFNRQVKPGQVIAIVGPTGCGKTTLINLLMRFYDVNDGAIYVDGTDVRKITRESLRSSYGLVLQETWLKSATVRENIAFGKSDASDEEIEKAARAVHAHSFIMRLPKGYDTILDEGDGNLSSGQKQLLCIARVMLQKPAMLILDEATSSVDTRMEHRIQEAFTKLMQGRTSFVVAHRLTTIRKADVILVMKDGSVIEQGNHDELLAKKGFYANLYRKQFEQ